MKYSTRTTARMLTVAFAVICSTATSYAQSNTLWVAFQNQSGRQIDLYTNGGEQLGRLRSGSTSDEIDFRNGERVRAYDPQRQRWIGTVTIRRPGTVQITLQGMSFANDFGAGGNGGTGVGGVRPSGAGSNRTQIEQQLFALMNQVRQQRGLSPLTTNATIQSIARPHTQDLAQRPNVPQSDAEAHTGYFGRVNQINSTVPNGRSWGEIIGAATPGPNAARQIVNGWVNSPGHAEVLFGKASGRALTGIAVESNANWIFATAMFADQVSGIAAPPVTQNDDTGGQLGNQGRSVVVRVRNNDPRPVTITRNGQAVATVPAGPSALNVPANIGDVLQYSASGANVGAVRVMSANQELLVAAVNKLTVRVRNESSTDIEVFKVSNGKKVSLGRLKRGGMLYNPTFGQYEGLRIEHQFGATQNRISSDVSLKFTDQGLVKAG